MVFSTLSISSSLMYSSSHHPWTSWHKLLMVSDSFTLDRSWPERAFSSLPTRKCPGVTTNLSSSCFKIVHSGWLFRDDSIWSRMAMSSSNMSLLSPMTFWKWIFVDLTVDSHKPAKWGTLPGTSKKYRFYAESVNTFLSGSLWVYLIGKWNVWVMQWMLLSSNLTVVNWTASQKTRQRYTYVLMIVGFQV